MELAPVSTGLDALTGAWLPEGGGSLAIEVSEMEKHRVTAGHLAVSTALPDGAGVAARPPHVIDPGLWMPRPSPELNEVAALSPPVTSINSDVVGKTALATPTRNPVPAVDRLTVGFPPAAPVLPLVAFATGLVAVKEKAAAPEEAPPSLPAMSGDTLQMPELNWRTRFTTPAPSCPRENPEPSCR